MHTHMHTPQLHAPPPSFPLPNFAHGQSLTHSLPPKLSLCCDSEGRWQIWQIQPHKTGVTSGSRVCCPGTDCHGLGRGRFLPCEISSRGQGHECTCKFSSASEVEGRTSLTPENDTVPVLWRRQSKVPHRLRDQKWNEVGGLSEVGVPPSLFPD